MPGWETREQTLAWLEKAYAEHSGELVTLKVSPAYDFLRTTRGSSDCWNGWGWPGDAGRSILAAVQRCPG